MSNSNPPPTHTELVTYALKKFSDRVAFRDGEITYAQAHDALGRLVAVLCEAGLRPGQGIGLLSPNRPEVWYSQVAPGYLGASYTALHPMGSLDDHIFSCDEAELRLLFVDPSYIERGSQLLERSAAVEQLFTFGPADTGRDVLALMDAATPTPLDQSDIDPEAIHWLLYTGGTTGIPKAARLSDRAIGFMAMSTAIGWDLPGKRNYLAVSPVSHAAGMLITSTFLAGGNVTMLKAWDPAEWCHTVRTNNITVGLLVPTMIYSLLDSGVLDSSDLPTLETIMYGASPMAPARLKEGIERLGQVFCQLYGQTECTGIISSLWRHQHELSRPDRFASCGQAMPGVRISLRDDDNNAVGPGESGEICVQSMGVMSSYHKRSELTEETLAGGWLHTGDIGRRDEDGFYYLVDRKKDMIVSGGFNIFPSEIEQVLAEHPSVSAAAVIGIPDSKWGEAVKAVVVPRPGMDIDTSELESIVKEKKGSHHAPKSFDIVDALPVTAVGKPDKKSLRDPYWADHERGVN